MGSLVWKSRISVLWLAVAILTIMHMVLEFASPGVVDELRTGKLHDMDTGGPVTALWVLFVLVPLLMALVPFVLSDRPIRWTNGIVGVVLALLWFPLPGSGEPMTAGALLVTAMVLVASLAIVWHAWKWPVEHPAKTDREHVSVG